MAQNRRAGADQAADKRGMRALAQRFKENSKKFFAAFFQKSSSFLKERTKKLLFIKSL
jgi:hypothetical protein